MITGHYTVARKLRSLAAWRTAQVCPTCGGEGRLETMTHLSYDGNQGWRVERCPCCEGNRLLPRQMTRRQLKFHS